MPQSEREDIEDIDPSSDAARIISLTERSIRHIAMIEKVRALLGGPKKKASPYRHLTQAEDLEKRIVADASGLAAEVWTAKPEGEGRQMETVTEERRIALGALEHGVHANGWTVDLGEGIGRARFLGEGGIRIDERGMSTVIPSGFAILFDDGAVTMVGADLSFEGSPQGFIRIADVNGYVKENGKVKDFPLEAHARFGDVEGNQLDSGYSKGVVFIDTLIFDVTVTREIEIQTEETDETDDLEETIRTLANTLSPLEHAILARRLTPEQVASVSEPTLRRLLDIAPANMPGAARMTVRDRADNGRPEIFVDSPYDETYLETAAETVHYSHPGGTNGLLPIYTNYLSHLVNWRAPVPQTEFRIYADVEKTVLLDRVVLEGNPRDHERFWNVTPEREEQPDVMFEPDVQVLMTERANVTVAFRTPYKNAFLELEGGGHFSTETIQSDEQLDFGTATLSINGALPSGTYAVHLLDQPNGRILDAAALSWNAETKQLAEAGAVEAFVPMASVVFDDTVPMETSLAEAQRQEAEQRDSVRGVLEAEYALSRFGGAIQTNVPDTPDGKALIRSKQLTLLGMACSMDEGFTVTDAYLWERFLATFPEWKRTEFATDREQQEHNYRRNAEWVPFRYALGSHEDASGRMMEAAMDAVLTARGGGDIEPFLQKLRDIPHDTMYGNTLQQLERLGVRLPDGNAFIGAAEKALYAQSDALAQAQRQADIDAASMFRTINGENYGGTGESETLEAQKEADAEAVHRRNLQTIMESDGMGTTLSRILAYAEVYEVDPDLVEDVTGIASVSHMANDGTGNAGAIILASTTYMPGSVVEFDNAGARRIVIDVPSGQNRTTPANVLVDPNTSSVLEVSIGAESMVNFWLENQSRDLNLTILGPGLPATGYSSLKTGNSGDSISLRLNPGTYKIFVSDMTVYTDIGGGQTIPPREVINAEVGMNIKQFNSANIEGRISLEGNDKTMPVSMKVAEFTQDTNGKSQRNMNYDGNETGKKAVDKLDPTKPVLVIIHGMDSSEDTDILVELAKSLKKYPNTQVVTIDWEDAAKDGIPTKDAQWTPAVGKWVARQLLNLGVRADNIELQGWSHGSYVAQAVAEEIFRMMGQKIGSLIALDPAGNWPMLSGFDHTIIDFQKYADYSLAIEGSWIAGSDALASTADVYMKLNPIQTGVTDIRTNHSLPPTVLANLLDYNRIVGGKQTEFISLNNILHPEYRPAEKGYTENSYAGGVDFVMDVSTEERLVLENGTYYTYPYASPLNMHYIDDKGLEQVIRFDGTPQ